jgi:hypothetical protein
MSDRLFDRETLLDISVNVIPLGIILFFVVTYAFVGDYPSDPVVSLVQMSIMGLTAIGLLVLTYYSGRAIASAEAGEETEALVGTEGE